MASEAEILREALSDILEAVAYRAQLEGGLWKSVHRRAEQGLVESLNSTQQTGVAIEGDPGLEECGVEEDEATAIRRELLLALGPGWHSTRDLATMVGVPPIHGDITPVRDALYILRAEGRVELQRRSGSLGYRWRLPTQQHQNNQPPQGEGESCG